jgi:hypothetical protein
MKTQSTQRRRHLARLLLLAITPVLAGVLGAAPSQAADNGAWSVAPKPPSENATAPRSYFVLEGDPGTRIKDEVRIQNWTDEPITFNLYGADGYNTAQDGFFALRDQGADMVGVGAWIKPLVSQVTVYGNTQVDVPVAIRIPANATPGDHVGGVVAMNTAVEKSGEGSESFDVGVQRAVGARVYLRVSGPVTPAVEVTDVELTHDRGFLPWSGKGQGTVTWTLENTGNVRLSPAALVRLSGLTGEVWASDERELSEVLPGQQVALSESIADVPAFGRVTATVEITAPDVEARGAATVWLVPWPGVLLVLLVLAGLTWWWRRRRGVLARRLEVAEQAPQILVPSEP